MEDWTCDCGRRNRAIARVCANCRIPKGLPVLHPGEQETAVEVLRRGEIYLTQKYGQPVSLHIYGRGDRPLTVSEAQQLVRETEEDLRESISVDLSALWEQGLYSSGPGAFAP